MIERGDVDEADRAALEKRYFALADRGFGNAKLMFTGLSFRNSAPSLVIVMIGLELAGVFGD